MSAKKIHKNDILAERGINLIQRIVLEMGWMWYPTGLEAGIDGIIEIRHPETWEVTNCIIQVQSKATSKAWQAETETSFEYVCDARDLEYWLNGNAPVLIVVSRPDSDEAYWAAVKDRFPDLASRKERRIRFDKVRDRFTPDSRTELTRIAVSRNAGIYFAPTPKTETLYTNLLPVSRYPESIYLASTEYRTMNDIRTRLREVDADDAREWILTEKLLISFHNLKEFPWPTVCDRGTVERINSDEWAVSADPEIRRRFVQLLNRCLNERMWSLWAKYDSKRKYFYFKPTLDLSPRKVRYKSIVNEATRTVFQVYSSKNDSSRVFYYRHSAVDAVFRPFGHEWFLELTPTYHYTSDGFEPYWNYERPLKGLKRIENNAAVLGQVVMWGSLLTKTPDLFDRKSLLTFNPLQTLETDVGLDDEAWLKHEEEEVAAAAKTALDQLELFEQ